jgi:hypothetical protein
LVKCICGLPALSLIPTVNGNTVRSFSTHGHLSAVKGSSTAVSRSDIRLIQYFDFWLVVWPEVALNWLFPYPLIPRTWRRRCVHNVFIRQRRDGRADGGALMVSERGDALAQHRALGDAEATSHVSSAPCCAIVTFRCHPLAHTRPSTSKEPKAGARLALEVPARWAKPVLSRPVSPFCCSPLRRCWEAKPQGHLVCVSHCPL